MSIPRFSSALIPALLVGVIAVGSCGGGGERDRRDEGDRAPEERVLGHVQDHPESGFSIRWPRDCKYIRESITDGPTHRAQQEFIYFCMRETVEGCQLQVNVLTGAHYADGRPAQSRFVVEIIERRIREMGTRIHQQRPLSAESIQGVDVHAAEPDGTGEVWIRGLLVGADVFVLMAWNLDGGVFEDPAIQDFFASFKIR